MSITNCQKHNCDYHDELLTVYAEGNATQQERQRVEKLLSQCPDCRRKVMELEQTWWALDVWEEDERQVPLRLTRFRSRLHEVKNQQPAWQKAFEQVAFFFRPAQLIPTMSFASVLIIAAVLMIQSGMLPRFYAPSTTPAHHVIPVADSQVSAADTTETSAANAEDKSALESRFDYYVALSQQEQKTKRLYNSHSNVQSVGFTPNKQILSSFEAMDEKPQLNPSVIITSQQ